MAALGILSPSFGYGSFGCEGRDGRVYASWGHPPSPWRLSHRANCTNKAKLWDRLRGSGTPLDRRMIHRGKQTQFRESVTLEPVARRAKQSQLPGDRQQAVRWRIVRNEANLHGAGANCCAAKELWERDWGRACVRRQGQSVLVGGLYGYGSPCEAAWDPRDKQSQSAGSRPPSSTWVIGRRSSADNQIV
jgi:hypothetical protein